MNLHNLMVLDDETTERLLMLQPLRWCCVDCVIHHERDVREEQKYIRGASKQ